MKQYGLNGSYYNEEMSSVKTLDLLPRYIYMSYSIYSLLRYKEGAGCWVLATPISGYSVTFLCTVNSEVVVCVLQSIQKR